MQLETKLNNIGKYFMDRYKEIWINLYKINKREDIRCNIINTFIMILNVSGEFLMIVVSSFDVISKKIGI